ncbi:MAG: tyrosine-type recombinase/integrase [Oscillatoriales cyanobacterium RU_3_3]|nr:tyrosine-type recombinase/integrase [Oscillatoriales cyanobacterium RU_3_3]
MPETSKRYKGKVGIDDDKGKLRISLPRSLFGKPKYIYLGLLDTPENRTLAEAKAKAIESDIAFGNFDFSLERYRNAQPRHLKIVGSEKRLTAKLKDLWDKYVQFKSSSWSISTLNNQIAQATRHIHRLPFQSVDDAVSIRDWLVFDTNLSQDAVKRLLVQLSAACNWAVKSGLIDANKFEGLAADIKMQKGENEEDKIDPFTAEERDLIIEAFETNKFSRYKSGNSYSHSSYAPYVKFSFYTGCRPSEAIALTWGDIDDRFIYFNKGVVMAGKAGTVQKRGLKTQLERRFSINNQLAEILSRIKPENAKSTDLIFGREGGKYLNQHSFRQVWKKVLNGLGIRLRTPYQTRHTFITMQIAAGESATRVGRWVGNSGAIIEKHYLGDISAIRPKEI